MSNASVALRKRAALVLAVLMVFSCLSGTALAGDTWPFEGAAAHGINQPSVHGYTSGQIADWSPQTDPYAAMLRSFVPLQPRIAPLSATQANPQLPATVKMFNLTGDYGNAFIENAPYTNKFAQNHFSFWQYTDFFSPWHGAASAYTPPEYYDALGQADWQQKWFEFGILNLPNPTYTDAAHKNGVISLACIFFSNNDRGQQTYKQMLVKDNNGNFPVAAKLIEMARYFGYDGYFFNQEEAGPNVTTADIPDYIAFLKALRAGGLYVQWYDSLNTTDGNNAFARTLANSNINMLYDKETHEQVSDSFFLDYTSSVTQADTALAYLNAFNAQNGTSLNFYDTVFAGLEAGGNRWSDTNKKHLAAKVNAAGIPKSSIATLGADFVHAGLDEDMSLSYPVRHRAENDYQWMTKVREQLWWSGPNADPTNTVCPAVNTAGDVYASNTDWKGIASVIAERSVIGGSHFYSSFNTGHGLRFYRNGAVSNDEEWSNMSLQDVPVTWQWWQETVGNKLAVDFDYGIGYKTDPTRQNYVQLGGYNSGSSLVVSGALNAENLLRLYKTDLAVGSATHVELTYAKSSADDASALKLALMFTDAPTVVEKISIPNSGAKTTGWITADIDLSAYAGRNIAVLGLVFDAGVSTISGYQVNIGQIRLTDGSAPALTAPTGLGVVNAFAGSNEMTVRWDRADYNTGVRAYNVYVNDTYVGGKYDGFYYIKNLPAKSGAIKVAPVGVDGKEGPAATVNFDLTSGVQTLTAESEADGTLTVSWGEKADVTVALSTVNVPTDRVIDIHVSAVEQKSYTFSGMPTNGDEYVVSVKKGNSDPISLSGRFIDTVCDPYVENWRWSGDALSLPMPNTRDWRYMYFYEDGALRNFLVTYLSSNTYRPMIIRGRSAKACLNFTSTAKFVCIVMEDYAGNKAAPQILREPADLSAVFPDPVFLQWVQTNVGATMSDVVGFTGAVDLNGLSIADYTGLNCFLSAKEVCLSGNPLITLVDKNIFPPGMTSLHLKNNPNLLYLVETALTGLPNLTSLDITGSAALQYVSLTGLPLNELVFGDRAGFPALRYLDLTGTRLDLARGAPVRDFANYVLVNQVTETGTVTVPMFGNHARGKTATGYTNAARLTDGNLSTSSYANGTVPANAVIDLGATVNINQIKLYSTSANYRAKDFTVAVSRDNATYDNVLTVTDAAAVNFTGALQSVAQGRYLRLNVTAVGNGTSNRLSEIEIYGYKDTPVAASVKYDGMLSRVALKTAIADAEAVSAAPYSIQSFAVLTQAIVDAKAVLTALDPTQEEMEEAVAALSRARDALIPKLTSLKLSPSSTSVRRGRTVDLSGMLQATPNVDPNWSFSSSNSAVTTVDSNGIALGVKSGMAVITVKALDGSNLVTQILVTVTI